MKPQEPTKPRVVRKGRRVVAMSPRDYARAAAGEDVFAPQVAPDGIGGDSDEVAGGTPGVTAREAEILREVPPHWFGGRGS